MSNINANNVLADIIDTARELDQCERLIKEAQEAIKRKEVLRNKLVELVQLYEQMK